MPRAQLPVEPFQTLRRIIQDQSVIVGPLSKGVTGKFEIPKFVRIPPAGRAKNRDTARRTVLVSQPSPSESDPLHLFPSNWSEVPNRSATQLGRFNYP